MGGVSVLLIKSLISCMGTLDTRDDSQVLPLLHSINIEERKKMSQRMGKWVNLFPAPNG